MIKAPWTPRNTVALLPQVGQRVTADLDSNVRTQTIFLRLRATLTLAGGPATAQFWSGSLLGMISEIGLTDGGKEIMVLDGPSLKAVAIAMNAGLVPSSRITTFADGAYTLEENLHLPVSWRWPSTLNPSETPYIQPNPDLTLQVFARLSSANANGVIVTTAGTAVLTNVTMDVTQEADRLVTVPAQAVPKVRQITFPVTAAIQNFPMSIKSPRALRALVIQQLTSNRGDVPDIISQVSLITDQVSLIGPQKMPWGHFAAAVASIQGSAGVYGFGGNGATAGSVPGGVYAVLDWQRLGSGRLSNIPGPKAGTNLRFECDVAPSAVAGALNSQIRVTLFELDRVQGTTVANSLID